MLQLDSDADFVLELAMKQKNILQASGISNYRLAVHLHVCPFIICTPHSYAFLYWEGNRIT